MGGVGGGGGMASRTLVSSSPTLSKYTIHDSSLKFVEYSTWWIRQSEFT